MNKIRRNLFRRMICNLIVTNYHLDISLGFAKTVRSEHHIEAKHSVGGSPTRFGQVLEARAARSNSVRQGTNLLSKHKLQGFSWTSEAQYKFASGILVRFQKAERWRAGDSRIETKKERPLKALDSGFSNGGAFSATKLPGLRL